MSYTLFPAKLKDALGLYSCLSVPDLEELKVSQVQPFEAIWTGIRASTAPVAIYDGAGSIAAIAGVVCVSEAVGAPWMLSTEAAKTEPIAFVKQARKWVEEQLTIYPVLTHQVYRHNHPHIKLLRLLGFEVESPTSPLQLFLPFVQCAPHSQ
jgi:hypothetical protein